MEEERLPFEKDAYVKRLEVRIDERQEQLGKLEEKARRLEGEARLAAEREVDELRQQLRTLQDALGEIRASSELAFKDMRGGVEEAWERFSKNLGAAVGRF